MNIEIRKPKSISEKMLNNYYKLSRAQEVVFIKKKKNH